MFIKKIDLYSFLSFNSSEFELGPLNILIGPNGSGKSNLIEALALLRSLPDDLAGFVRRAGGIQDLIHLSDANQQAFIRIQTERGSTELNYHLKLAAVQSRPEIVNERLWAPPALANQVHFSYDSEHPEIRVGDELVRINRQELDPNQSIMAQRKDPDRYPQLSAFASGLKGIRIYRDWLFGRQAPTREPQKADLPDDFLLEDFSNLALVINKFKLNPKLKARLLKELHWFSGRFTDLNISVTANQVQLFLQDGEWNVPAHRLSDGTIRYLCLLAILLHPNPPSLVCIEEPELGMHPDMISHLAELLEEASERTQLVVTTHSDILVDALSHRPEAIVTVENREGNTHFQRLSPENLKDRLADKGLGQIWLSGDIGATRF